MENKMKLAFIGAGNMAEALLKGILEKELPWLESICLCDVDANRLETLKSNYPSIQVETSNKVCFENSDIVFLSVKPQQISFVLEEISSEYSNQLVISIAAGISLGFIQKILGQESHVIRVMPNTPALVGKGVSVISPSENVDLPLVEKAISLLECVGQVLQMPEENMDVVTAISGSGPAYFFKFLESLVEVGQSLGLTSEESEQLALYTGIGALELANQSADSIEVLRQKVTSKGGTTEAALNSLEENQFSEIIKKAVHKACHRSKEIGEMMK